MRWEVSTSPTCVIRELERQRAELGGLKELGRQAEEGSEQRRREGLDDKAVHVQTDRVLEVERSTRR